MNQRSKSSALEKALLILDLIVDQKRPVSLAYIVEETGLTKPTVQRVLQQLESTDLIQRSPEKTRYWIGDKLNQLATSTLGSLNQPHPSRAVLQELVDEIGESSNMGMLDQDQIQYIERVEPNLPLRFQLRSRRRGPLHCTAIGKLLLAHKAEDSRDQLLAALTLNRFTDNTITDKKTLERELNKICETGYSVNNEEYLPSLIAVAVPIKDAQGQAIAGVSVHASLTRISLQQAISYVPRLQQAARQLETAWALRSP